jgi:hypothetical protein
MIIEIREHELGCVEFNELSHPSVVYHEVDNSLQITTHDYYDLATGVVTFNPDNPYLESGNTLVAKVNIVPVPAAPEIDFSILLEEAIKSGKKFVVKPDKSIDFL